MKLFAFLITFLLFLICTFTIVKTADTTAANIPYKYLDGEEEDDEFDSFDMNDDLNDEIDNDDNADVDDFLDSRTLNLHGDQDYINSGKH